MVVDLDRIFYEQEGRIFRSPLRFRDKHHVMRIIERIVAPLGRRIDESSPMVDARLPDGSRVNITIPPVSPKAPTITIRKFRSGQDADGRPDLRSARMSEATAEFLAMCVRAHLNIIISGGTGTGKTTLLNALSAFIPNTERIVTIEDPAELKLQQEHVITLEARPPSIEGKNAVKQRDLVRNCLRMRPDRIIVGEVRGSEVFRHAPGDEHRPRRLDLHGPRKHAARRRRPPRKHGADGGHGPAGAGHPRADCLRHPRLHPGHPPAGRLAQVSRM